MSGLTIEVLRELFRNLKAFRSVMEAEGIDTITDDDGNDWCLWDIEYLLEQADSILPPRMSQSIKLFLVDNLREADVAIMMGVSPTNPVGMYATKGLERLIEAVNDGRLSRFRGGD